MEVEKRVFSDAHQTVAVIVHDMRRVFKLHEVFLVTLGTLVNGFGPWLVKLLAGAALAACSS